MYGSMFKNVQHLGRVQPFNLLGQDIFLSLF